MKSFLDRMQQDAKLLTSNDADALKRSNLVDDEERLRLAKLQVEYDVWVKNKEH